MTESAEPSALLREGLERLGVPDPGGVHVLLEKYLDELERWNPRFGLVKYADRRELVIKHVLDSLSGWPAVQEALRQSHDQGRDAPGREASGHEALRGSVLDVGSGAGFPGIPLAVAMPSVAFTLLERMARRVSFLKTCAVLLGLPHLHVMQADLAEAKGDFDVVTFRAVAPTERFLRDIGNSGVRWRTFVAYKGRKDRAQGELDDVRRSFGTDFDLRIVALEALFLEEERCLIVASRKDC
jgi:16S rRNA (guanine527-N7)-methyltransferase